MGKFEIKKLEDLEYDELITLGVIESDEDLTSIFRERIQLSFSILRTIAKQGKLNDDTKDTLNGIFNGVILTKREYIDTYKKLSDPDYTYQPQIIEPINEPVVEVIAEKHNYNKAKPLKEGVLPRRYGKVKILEDVKAQNGVITTIQRAQLANNDIKNGYVKLEKRLIKDSFTDGEKLSDEQYRQIVSLSNIFKNQIKIILNTK
jgi:hypothetical protein